MSYLQLMVHISSTQVRLIIFFMDLQCTLNHLGFSFDERKDFLKLNFLLKNAIVYICWNQHVRHERRKYYDFIVSAKSRGHICEGTNVSHLQPEKSELDCVLPAGLLLAISQKTDMEFSKKFFLPFFPYTLKLIRKPIQYS